MVGDVNNDREYGSYIRMHPAIVTWSELRFDRIETKLELERFKER